MIYWAHHGDRLAAEGLTLDDLRSALVTVRVGWGGGLGVACVCWGGRVGLGVAAGDS